MNTLLVKCKKCGGNLYPEYDTTLEIHCLQSDEEQRDSPSEEKRDTGKVKKRLLA